MSDQVHLPPETTALVHVVGPAEVWEGRLRRQRCTWCGALLDEVDLARTAVMIPEGKTEDQARADGDLELPIWPVGGFLRVDGPVRVVVDAEQSDVDPNAWKVPADCCMRLDPEVTR